MTGGVLLSLDQLSCVRGGRTLFEGLSVSLRAGDALMLAGPNGVGKSSLLRVVAGLLAPAGGKIERPARQALLAHELALDEGQSLMAALRFWARLDGAGDGDVREALQAVALDGLADVPVRFLSSGQKRRAGLARVIAMRAPVWLLDEPGVGLDSHALGLLAAAVERHRAAGGAVMAATHMDLGVRDCRTLTLDGVR